MCGGAASLASGFVKGLGSVFEGRQQRDYYDARADQDVIDAQYEEQLGGMRAAKIRKAGWLTRGAARAAYAGSGVEVGRGTPLVVGQRIGANVEEDALANILSASRRAEMLRKEASGLRSAASHATTMGLIGGISSLLGGAADAYGNNDWIKLDNAERSRSLYARGMGTGMVPGGGPYYGDYGP